jgi:hypothetical protein
MKLRQTKQQTKQKTNKQTNKHCLLYAQITTKFWTVAMLFYILLKLPCEGCLSLQDVTPYVLGSYTKPP